MTTIKESKPGLIARDVTAFLSNEQIRRFNRLAEAGAFEGYEVSGLTPRLLLGVLIAEKLIHLEIERLAATREAA